MVFCLGVKLGVINNFREMIKIKEVVEAIEQFAPRSWQQGWDNSGMQVGRLDEPLTGVVLSLDMTMEVLDEAIKQGANLVVTHHPLLFTGLKSVAEQNNEARIIYKAIRSGVAIYSCHTNIDSAPGGINTVLARDILGLSEVSPLEASPFEGVGLGAIGDFREPVSLERVLRRLKERLPVEVLRYSSAAGMDLRFSRAAVCGGSGASMVEQAIEAGADLMVTGDLKYGDFQRFKNSITLIDIGHWEGENHVIEIFYDIITKKIPTFVNHITRMNSNHVNYYL